ncbi:MAG: hypothetical protein RLZZ127_1133 [Planctomycetota bacterium]|jgi:hypothetical protein
MNIDRTTVALRQRSVIETMDLAVAVIRRHWIAVPALGAAGILPWALLDWWLIGRAGDEEPWAVFWYPFLLLVAAQIPLATAPLTAFLGQALFEPRPRAGAALVTAWRAAPRLLAAGLLRGVFSIIPPVLLAWPAHLVEAIVLEGQGFGAAWRRAAALRGADAGASPLLLLLAAPVLIAALAVVAGTAGMLHGLLLHADPWRPGDWGMMADPGRSPAVHLAVWAAVAYLAVVRFFAYIDLRTRAEGWALDLDLRRTAARIEGAR